MQGTTLLYTMATLTGSLQSSLCHLGHDSVQLNLVPGTSNEYGVPVRAGVKRRLGGGGGALLWSSDGLKPGHGLARKVPCKSRKGMRVRSQVGTDMAATVVETTETGEPVQKVVIVGAGIAGLSAALALHRVGVKALVLEQYDSIRTSGTSLSLWASAWRALEYLGVAESLRKKYIRVTKMSMCSRAGELLARFDLDNCPGGPHEVRSVERKVLSETLAADLPAGTIRLSSKVRAVHREPEKGLIKVELENGSVISTKVLVGCDGVNSVIGEWMGLPPTRYVGQIGIRGVGDFPNGHEFGSQAIQYLGEGPRCGIFPYSTSKVYWFVLIHSVTPGPKVTDKNLIKAEALELVKEGWPERLKELIHNTPVETMSRSALSDRWNIPGITPPVVKGGVTLAGDALHPMTPNLGQGGGTAIEDGIVLARSLGPLLSQPNGGDAESIHKALEVYAAERQKRTLPITIRSFVFGLLLGIGFPPVVFIRNRIAVPKLANPQSFLSHTLYDVGPLPSSLIKAK